MAVRAIPRRSSAPRPRRQRAVHDINNQLAVLQGGIEILRHELAQDGEDENTQAILDDLEGAARAMAQLASTAVGVAEPAVAAESDLLVVASVARRVRWLVGDAVHVWVDLPERLPRFRADPVDVERSVVNLVRNAAEAAQGGACLTLTARLECRGVPRAHLHGTIPPGAWVVIEVWDSGPGMAPELVRRVFEAGASTSSEPGRGVGLNSVAAAVQRSGGHAVCVSSPGHGTRFELYFPALIG